MTFGMMTHEEILEHWPTCREMLLKAFRNMVHIHSVDDYYPQLIGGTMQLWAAVKDGEIVGSVVTSVDQGSNAKVCTILSLGGNDLREWVKEMDIALTEFAETNECQAIETVTRPGFSRFVPNFVADGVVFVKLIGEKNG